VNPEEILDLYRSSGALREGHFRLSSGLHSNRYFQSGLVLSQPEVATRLGAALAARFASLPVDIVVGPAVGAVIVSHEVARALGRRSYFAERVNDRFALRRGFHLDKGARTLIVDDVLTTGGSVREIAHLVTNAGAVVAGFGCLVNRGVESLPGPVFESLVKISVTSWSEADCPLCREGTPLEVRGTVRT
jgi:orotate phosphoribosyltransferase